MFACNRCNQLLEQVGYCSACGCPENRELKALRIFLSHNPDHDVTVKGVQLLCEQACIAQLMEFGSWEFSLTQNRSTSWWDVHIVADFEVWDKLDRDIIEAARNWLDDYLEGIRMEGWLQDEGV